jgi:hypothetical protein
MGKHLLLEDDNDVLVVFLNCEECLHLLALLIALQLVIPGAVGLNSYQGT